MTTYLNPTYGDDDTAQVGSRARPFKTAAALQAALEALPPPESTPEDATVIRHRVVETHQVPPAEDEGA
jgi:hypothetical protein